MNDQPSPSIHSVTVGDPHAPLRIVFLHGLFGRGKNFTRIAAALKDSAQSLLVDLPNHGQSAWTNEVGYPLIADLVADHLRADFATDGPVDIVGHSMGGKIAMVLALRHPDLVRRLIVLDIAPTAASDRGTFPHLLNSLATVQLDALTRRTDANDQLVDLIPEDTVRGFLLQNLKREGDGFAWEPHLDLLRAELDTIMGFPDTGGSSFDGPVLWVGGSRSDYVNDADEPTMRALFPRTIRMTIRGAGHWVHSEKPDEVITSIRGFLTR